MLGGILGGNKSKAGKLAKGLVKSFGGGGLADLLTKFDKKKSDSWVSTGDNESLSGQEVQEALGPAQLEELAREADMTPEEASEQLAAVIPEAINQVTPEGQIPEESNLESMVQTIAEEELPPEAPAQQTYTVVSGDTLSAIAQRFYGDANAYMRIFEANRDKLNDPNLIHPGQELVIPS
jgi:uncharacterized protein YidB (DUF937 family)